MSAPLDLGSKTTRWLIELECEMIAGGFQRFTTWTEDVSYGGHMFTSQPDTDVTVPPNVGALNEKSFVLDIGTYDDALAGHVLAPCYMTLYFQALPDTDDPLVAGEVLTTWTWANRAKLTNVTRNPKGRNGTLRLEFVSPKGRTKSALGMPSSAQCNWTLFDAQCQAVWAPETATLVAIDVDDPQKVTISDFDTTPTAPGGVAGRFYQDGYIKRDGLVVDIRDWDPALPDTFYLRRRPPTSWVGVVEGITLYPGCSKAPDVCDGRWGRLGTIGCFGIKTPNRNPVFGV